MIDTQISIRRSGGLWGGVSPETVGNYRKELEKLKGELAGFDWRYEHNLFGSKELMKNLQYEIDEEIKLCLFYDEYQNRQINEPNFGEWVFTKQEDIKPLRDWIQVPGEQWTKTNGRVKATIQFDRGGLMVKITLEYQNDSQHLDFHERSRYVQAPIAVAHLKSESSIAAKVEELKRQADAFLQEHLYPSYSTREFDLFKQLLCTT